jgi:DNA-binding NarL/FixJ family response regulator
MTKDKIKIFLVDDDVVFLKSLEIDFLESADFSIQTFATGELCLDALNLSPDIIVLDYYLDGIDRFAMNGLDTLDKIRATNPDLPVIMLSSQDKIDVAIECMHHKASDYVVKSETSFMRLQKIISTIYKYKKIEKELSWYMDRM